MGLHHNPVLLFKWSSLSRPMLNYSKISWPVSILIQYERVSPLSSYQKSFPFVTAVHFNDSYSPLQIVKVKQIAFYNRQFQMGKKIRKGQRPSEQQTQLYDKITKIEASILKKIQKLKLLPKFSYCQHLSLEKNEAQRYDENINYYDRYWKRFLINEVGRGEIAKLQGEITYLSSRLLKIESLFQLRAQELSPYEKFRTKGHKIDQVRPFTCPFCKRCYNDKETLLLHQQIKHMNNIENQKKEEEDEDIYQEDQDNAEMIS